MRLIIRFSLNNDTNSIVRNAVNSALSPFMVLKHRIPGTHGSTTGTWEGANLSIQDVAGAIDAMMNIFEYPANVNAGPHFAVDHIWIYTDKDI
jgi:hypothetical protein